MPAYLLAALLFVGCKPSYQEQAENYGHQMCLCMENFAANPNAETRLEYDNCVKVITDQAESFFGSIEDPLERMPLDKVARDVYQKCYEEHREVLEKHFTGPVVSSKVDISSIKDYNQWLNDYETHINQYLKLYHTMMADPDNVAAYDAFATYDTEVHQLFEKQAAALYIELEPDQRTRLDLQRARLDLQRAGPKAK